MPASRIASQARRASEDGRWGLLQAPTAEKPSLLVVIGWGQGVRYVGWDEGSRGSCSSTSMYKVRVEEEGGVIMGVCDYCSN